MLENIVVLTIVAVVFLLAARSVFRTVRGQDQGCGCGTKSCPNSCDPRVDVKKTK